MNFEEYELPEIFDAGDQLWREHAACRGLDTNMFFPERGDHHGVEAARQVCMSCPVRTECGEYALGFPDYAMPGIWGGLSGRQRREMKWGKAS